MSRPADASSLMGWTRLGPDSLVPREQVFVAGDGTLMALTQDGGVESFTEEALAAIADAWLGTADDPMELIRDSDILEASPAPGQDGPRKYFNVRNITPDEAVTQLRDLAEGRWVSAICRKPAEDGGAMTVLASRDSPTGKWVRGRAPKK